MTILDIGIGTGTLAKRFCELGCQVYGVDFSREMLEKARKKLPQVELFRADLLGEWPAELRRNFERIVSAYVLHEFDLPTKIRVIRKLLDNGLADGGLSTKIRVIRKLLDNGLAEMADFNSCKYGLWLW